MSSATASANFKSPPDQASPTFAHISRHHRDGYRWLRVIALPVRDAQGNISRWYGTSTDIEDAKLLEAERELVNRELDHRIGNLFALVNGLISLSLRDQPEAKPFAQDVRERLGLLHKAHLLIKAAGQDQSVPVRDILRDVLAPYGLNGEGREVVTGHALQVRAELASAFALVFHELATNSAKYGALSVPEGRIQIALHKDTEGTTIEWHEQGCVVGDGDGQARGFGSKLMTAVVEGQFRGTFERNLGPQGMRVTLHLPSELFQEKDDDPV